MTEYTDVVRWTDKETGLECEARQHRQMGHWCGYVLVPKGYPLYERGYGDNDFPDIDVHGGVTWSDFWDDGSWRIGFDCAHAWDRIPGRPYQLFPPAVERDLDYVKCHCALLAKQISEYRQESKA